MTSRTRAVGRRSATIRLVLLGGFLLRASAVAAQQPLEVSVTPDRALPVATGTPVTWFAGTAFGIAPYTYKFLLYDGTKWTIGQDWNASNTWTWTPKVAGSYAIQLWVRNAGSVAEYDAWAGITTTIPAVPFITSFVPSSPGPVVMGIPVTWTVAAWGGIDLEHWPGLECVADLDLDAYERWHLHISSVGAKRGFLGRIRSVTRN